MQSIYEHATGVLIWLGPDNARHQAKAAIDAIFAVSELLCTKLAISVDPDINHDIYQEVVLNRRDVLPSFSDCEFSSESLSSLGWFFSHPYFTRVWAIQEINANARRLLHCNGHSIEWNRVDLVASYIMAEPSIAAKSEFAGTHCWWAVTVSELAKQSKNWLSMLYLASNYFATDPRDVVYGLRGMMDPTR